MIEDFVTTKEAVEILRLAGLVFSQRHVAWLCSKGRILGARKMGKTWLILKDALGVYIMTNPRGHKKAVEPDSVLSMQTMHGGDNGDADDNKCPGTVA